MMKDSGNGSAAVVVAEPTVGVDVELVASPCERRHTQDGATVEQGWSFTPAVRKTGKNCARRWIWREGLRLMTGPRRWSEIDEFSDHEDIGVGRMW